MERTIHIKKVKRNTDSVNCIISITLRSPFYMMNQWCNYAKIKALWRYAEAHHTIQNVE